jgi:hypothetical protein
MNIMYLTRIAAVSVLAVSSFALAPAAHAVCAGQYASNHAENGEKPCSPAVAPAAQSDSVAQDSQT